MNEEQHRKKIYKNFSNSVRGKVLIILPLVILLMFFFASSLTSPSEIGMSLETDREEYSSSDVMQAYVEITSSDFNGEVFVRLHGVPGRNGVEYVNTYKLVDIAPGITQVNFSEALPVCSVCAGLSPGNYQIIAEVLVDDSPIASATKTIYLS
jgi:hypothetical protein